MSSSPFHEGERAIQERLGIGERMESIGSRVIRDFMPDQHRELFTKLPFLIVGALDAADRPWASIVVGAPGFVESPDPRTLAWRARVAAGGPLDEGLAVGTRIGILGIELETRRRNRMNGTVVARGDGVVVRVDQSFGNCPKYIVQREHRFVTTDASPPRARDVGPSLGADVLASIARADTFFIASASPDTRSAEPSEGVDVSHRGGSPGFVRAYEQEGRTVLVAPDYVGNFHFNTFGNLERNPRAGLLFVDFDDGSVLALTGEAEVVWEGPEIAAFEGALRLLRFRLSEGRYVERAIPLRWSRVAANG